MQLFRKIRARMQESGIKWAKVTDETLTIRNHVYVDLVTIRSKAEAILEACHDLLDETVTAEHALISGYPPKRTANA